MSPPKTGITIALGLMNYSLAQDDLRTLLDHSKRIPEQLKQLAIGLGLMGDRSVVPNLLEALTEGSRVVAAQAALASALGLVDAQDAIEPC